MADIPHKLLVLKRLVACIEGTAGLDHNGDPYNLIGSVYRGRTSFGEETELPAISILEGPAPDIGIFAGENEARSGQWLLLLQGWAQNDAKNPNDPAYWLQAAVEQQLATINGRSRSGMRGSSPNHLLGGIITAIEIGPSVVRPLDEKTSSRAFYYQPIRVGLADYTGKPYLQDS